MIKEINIIRPDDWHLHLRDGLMLRSVLPETTRHFSRALIMPNLLPPVVRSQDVVSYRQQIIDAIPAGDAFEPKMTLYLTENTDPNDLATAFKSGLITSAKLYPSGATTNSTFGIKNFDNIRHTLEKMSDIGCPLCVHGEVTHDDVDIFDREAVFIEKILHPVRLNIPDLKIVFEHITTIDAIEYVRSAEKNLAATITTHHLFINRNHIFMDGIRPHYYCLPIAKREKHRLALREAATLGDKRFFLGTDSAPHLDNLKETACGCAGCFTATNTMPLLAQVFDDENALDRLEGFVSRHGASFYNLAPNSSTITLVKTPEPINFPKFIPTSAGNITVFAPNQAIYWRVIETS